MSHSHQHKQHVPVSHGRAFAIGIGLNIAFVIVEIVYGLLANSSALLADAGHNASDVLGLIFAWTAAWLATLKPKGKYTYGFRKTTVLASMLNAFLLLGAIGLIGWNAILKLYNPNPVAGTQIIIVAAIGVIINTITALLFMKGQKNDLNIKGAFLHMAVDAGVSVGVVFAGVLINITGKLWIDPLTSFLIMAIILWGTWKLFIDSIHLALDAVPNHLNIHTIHKFLENKQGVREVHDLHVWAISTSQTALTAHLVMPNGTNNEFLCELQEEIEHTFGITHTTIQIEKEKRHHKTK